MDNNLQPLYVSEAERQVMAAALGDFARTGQVTRDRAVDAGNHELAVSLTTQLEAAAAALVRLQSAAPKAEAHDLSDRLKLHGTAAGLLGGSLAESPLWARSRHSQLPASEGTQWETDRRGVAESVVRHLKDMMADLPAPVGHQWKLYERHELTWYMGGPGNSVSAFLEPLNMHGKRAEQSHGEVRVFLDEPRATIFLGTGPMVEGQHRSVFADGAAHTSGKSYPEALLVAKTLIASSMAINEHVAALQASPAPVPEDEYEGAFKP